MLTRVVSTSLCIMYVIVKCVHAFASGVVGLTVLVSFRGTASLANALADIQVGFAASSLLPYTLSCIAAVLSTL